MTAKNKKTSVQEISVLVPKSPFVKLEELKNVGHCLAALNVVKLMEWWPGNPHTPHRDAIKVKNIQRSLDWKRVVQIAAYLLQEEIIDAPDKINEYFKKIYEPKKWNQVVSGPLKYHELWVLNVVNIQLFLISFFM